ncbi:hypothetical protein [Streptomyces sp. 4N124]|uniref:hypothetical protein n=1 Tax=Streptomyces sp. 4N124 TaxID=3457420 RepID=UPI003FCF4875
MTSTNTPAHEVAYYWFAWVDVSGLGRAFASGTVTGPRGYTRADALHDITDWLTKRACTCPRNDLTLLPATPETLTGPDTGRSLEGN